MARSTIIRDLAELHGAASGDAVLDRVRRPGGGRKKLTESDPPLLSGLQELVESTTRGNTGWVSVGIDHDTARFAVNTIRLRWQSMGRARYSHATSLLITADCGGSNGARLRLWKYELRRLADELAIPGHGLSPAPRHQ